MSYALLTFQSFIPWQERKVASIFSNYQMTLFNTLSLLFSSFSSGLLINYLDIQERKKDDAPCLARFVLVVSQLQGKATNSICRQITQDRLEHKVNMDPPL